MMLQKGIRKFVYARVNRAVMMTDEHEKAKREMGIGKELQIVEYHDMSKIKGLLSRTIDYIDYCIDR